MSKKNEKKQAEDIRKKAVRQERLALDYVKRQPAEMTLFARKDEEKSSKRRKSRPHM